MPNRMKACIINKKKNFFASAGLILALLVFIVSSCSKADQFEKYQSDFFGPFDTYTVVIGYAKSEKEFEAYAKIIYDKLVSLSQYYTIYKDYEGIVNLKTINDNAGIAPVKVADEIIDMLTISADAYTVTNGRVNIALGSVLSIWHDYRERGIGDMMNAELPPFDILHHANVNTDISGLIIDRQNNTVYLTDSGMSLDVGSTAKGYAARLAVEAAKEAGLSSALVNVGGNIIAVGKPLDGVRDRWGVGVQDPKLDIDGVNNIADTVFVNDMAVVTSGNYQRYYIVDGKKYNHIIDPDTLMPAERYDSVTVVTEDSAFADILSTALFILPVDEGKALLDQYSAGGIWIYDDGSVEFNDAYKNISKKYGGYSAKDE